MALDARYFQIVLIGMMLFITDSCVIGFCGNMEFLKNICKSRMEKTMFTFATLNFLTTQNLVPSCVANIGPLFARVFEIFASIFIADVSLAIVWHPIAKVILVTPLFLGSVVRCLAKTFCLAETAAVQWLLSVLSCDCEATGKYLVLIVAAVILLFSAKCNHLFSEVRNLLEKKGRSGPPCCLCPGEEAGEKPRSQHRSRSRSRSRRLSASNFDVSAT